MTGPGAADAQPVFKISRKEVLQVLLAHLRGSGLHKAAQTLEAEIADEMGQEISAAGVRDGHLDALLQLAMARAHDLPARLPGAHWRAEPVPVR